MKNLKLILLTLFIFVSGLNIQSQDRKAMFFNSSTTVIQPNTFIGGVGATSVTSIADFIALTGGITAGNISNFEIDSNDNVSFFVNAAYTINQLAFVSDLALTYYIDEKCTHLNKDCFNGTDNCEYFYFPSVTTSADEVWQIADDIKVISIPLCTPIGTTTGDNKCFNQASNLEYVITHADNETNNGGSPDGDLTGVSVTISNIRYVSNTTPPGNITDLTVDAVGGGYLDISWSAPSTTNAIIYYEVWVNNAFVELTSSISYIITGLSLNTSYKIQIKTLDEFGNRSGFSNTVNQTTNASYQIPTGDLVAHWDFNANSNDAIGTNDGTDTNITYSDGESALFISTSKIIVPDSNDFSFVGDVPFSFHIDLSYTSFNGNAWLIQKRAGSTSEREYVVYSNSGDLNFLLYDQSAGGFIRRFVSWTPVLGQRYVLGFTYDGSENQNNINIYIDAIKQTGTTQLSGTYNGMINGTSSFNIGLRLHNNDKHFDGNMFELALFNIELSEIQVIEIEAKNDADLELTD